MLKKLIILGATLAVLLPIVIHIRDTTWSSSPTQAIFPIFGLLAFTLLWLHSISGVFEEKLQAMFDFDTFVHWTALTILASMLLHPLLLLFIVRFQISVLLSGGTGILLGITGLFLLLTYDIGKLLKRRYPFFSRQWQAILIISNIGFILTFFHSLKLGSDVQAGFMHYLWIFYGITGILAIFYTYAIKPLARKV